MWGLVHLSRECAQRLQETEPKSKLRPSAPGTCWRCHQTVHLRRDCTLPTSPNETFKRHAGGRGAPNAQTAQGGRGKGKGSWIQASAVSGAVLSPATTVGPTVPTQWFQQPQQQVSQTMQAPQVWFDHGTGTWQPMASVTATSQSQPVAVAPPACLMKTQQS